MLNLAHLMNQAERQIKGRHQKKIPSEMEVAPLHNGFFELSNYWVSQ